MDKTPKHTLNQQLKNSSSQTLYVNLAPSSHSFLLQQESRRFSHTSLFLAFFVSDLLCTVHTLYVSSCREAELRDLRDTRFVAKHEGWRRRAPPWPTNRIKTAFLVIVTMFLFNTTHGNTELTSLTAFVAETLLQIRLDYMNLVETNCFHQDLWFINIQIYSTIQQ